MEEDVEEAVDVVREAKKAKWVHMDVVEKDKMRWMLPLPPPARAEQIFQARFDFDGVILPADIDLPGNCALYNHGEEPERAGYSAHELMLLSKSLWIFLFISFLLINRTVKAEVAICLRGSWRSTRWPGCWSGRGWATMTGALKGPLIPSRCSSIAAW